MSTNYQSIILLLSRIKIRPFPFLKIYNRVWIEAPVACTSRCADSGCFKVMPVGIRLVNGAMVVTVRFLDPSFLVITGKALEKVSPL